jgi:hypothetical protein
MGGTLHWDVQKGGGAVTVAIAGEIGEQAELRELLGSITGDVVFDLGGVRRINSNGAHKWIEFVRALPPAARVSYTHCSPAFVLQLNLIDGFGGRGHVKSFFAPYVCAACDREQLQLIDSADARRPGWTPPAVACEACRGAMAFDADPARYVRFLRGTDAAV